MPTATWNSRVVADSDACVELEGNQYFPVASVETACLVPSETTSVCPWKGRACYYDVVVDSAVAKDAAGYYPELKPVAGEIEEHIAFWRGVEVAD